MKQYDPFRPPDPDEWLSMDEQRRIDLTRAYHRRARIRLPNEKVHAVVHTIVENQLALGEEVPVRTLQRLMAEGLDRHQAIHAVGLVLMEFIADVLNRPEAARVERRPAAIQPYYDALEKLTAESWRQLE